MKKLAAILMALMLVLSLCACASGTEETAAEEPATEAAAETTETTAEEPAEIPDISLTLWGSELTDFQDTLRVMCDNFIAAYADEANITIEIGAQSESTAKDTILTDISAAADVFYFADDQIGELVNAGALQPVESVDAITEANGGADAGAVQASTVGGTLYAYPAMGGNGYFLYYDTEYVTAEQAGSWAGLLEAANAADKQVTMQLNSGWYLYGFFKGAGFTCSLADDKTTTECDWNTTGGTDVAQAILDITADPGFINLDDAAFVTGVQEGTIIAGVNGSWNAASVQEAWGDNYATAKLPTYTLNGSEVQMGSFDGYKLVGVNAYSENVGWAMRLAEWLTNEENQIALYEGTGGSAVPSNVNAASSESVQANPVVAALAMQSQFASAQSLSVGGNYWTPTETLGNILANGNPDGTDLQQLLDETVAGVTAPVG
ncbi:MAG TPA: extracellular solute-binding protein [Eubacteriales bacterium]|nr:extracellular solute-binding protein [Eubacteriales bacterium]